MTTALDLITAAFQKIGIDSPTTAQTTSALTSLNNLLGSCGIELLQPSVTRESFSLSVGTASYTIGSAGTFNTTRPIRIENAFLRDSVNYDSPLTVIAAKDWNDIIDKNVSALPEKLYFVPEVTLAKIIFDCKPDYAYTLYLESWKPFTEYTTTGDTVTLNPEHREFLVYNLALSLAEDWDRVVKDSVIKRAAELKYLISNANAATRPVPRATFDDLSVGRTMNINTGV